jgi:transcriptional regulator with XRE-family HTH domain
VHQALSVHGCPRDLGERPARAPRHRTRVSQLTSLASLAVSPTSARGAAPGDPQSSHDAGSVVDARLRDLGEFIKAQREIGQLSLRKLSELAGVSNPYLSQIERGLRKPSADILQQLAKALEISAETLYVRAGILEGRAAAPHEHDAAADTRDPLQRVLDDDPALTPDQRLTLLTLARTFRAETERAAQSKAAG